VPVPPDRRTPPVSGSSPARAPSLSRSLPSGSNLLAPVFFTRALLLSLCLAGPVRQLLSRCPACPLFSLYAVGLPCQLRPPHARRGPTSAHSRTSPDFSTTMPAHAPNSFLRAPPAPRTRPPPHFAQLCPLSRSALAARRRRRPAPAFSTIQLAGDRAKPTRTPPRGETPVPMPNFLYCTLCSTNFGFIGARPRRTAVLARWPVDLARSGSPALVPKVPLPLLKLAKALACLKPPPRGRYSSPELPRPARDLLSAVLPSLPSDSWPLPCH
jgi:hypothetical protein